MTFEQQTTVIARLALHQSQRCQAVPTLSVLVGKTIIARQLWTQWLQEASRPTTVCVYDSSVALFEAWVSEIAPDNLRSHILQNLATQSPGDLDYKCRDQISSWFVGKVKETTALNKLKPMLSEAKVDVTNQLANQQVGEFFAIRAGEVTSLLANMSLIRAEQVPIETIQELAISAANQQSSNSR